MRRANVLSALPHDRESVDSLRGKVVHLGKAALPRVASAAESTGDAVSSFALSSSRQVARTLRKHQPSRATRLAALLPLSPLMRRGLRLAARNPAIVAVAGLGIAVFGFAAWRRQHATATPDTAAHADADAADSEREDQSSDGQPNMREL